MMEKLCKSGELSPEFEIRKEATEKKPGFQPAAGVSIQSILEAANRSSNKEWG